jgi:hypothetical protein
MPVTLNASTSSGLVQTADTSGTIELQSNGTTKLTVSSSGVNIGQMNGGAITSGTAVASTSGTSIDFTSIPSWVKRITVMFNGVSTNGTSNLLIQVGSGSVTTSGYSSSASYATTSVSSVTSTAGFVVQSFNSAATLTSGNVSLCLISGNAWTSSGVVSLVAFTGTQFNAGNSSALSGALDRVRITTVGGTDTFDAGSINILYEG